MKAGDLSSAQSDSRLGKGTHAQMGSRITVEFLSKTIADKAWEFGNQVLYDMCRLHPDHKQDEIIIGKIWLIGRTYAAAIERRRSIGDSVGDAFYEDIVAPKIRRSEIDVWFEAVRTSNKDDVHLHLQTHARVMRLFTEISRLEKRSLASKYLHFHFPEHFYIYDSRAQKMVSAQTDPVRKKLPALWEHDSVYARFFLRCRTLHLEFENLLGKQLSPRQFDKVLLAQSRQLATSGQNKHQLEDDFVYGKG